MNFTPDILRTCADELAKPPEQRAGDFSEAFTVWIMRRAADEIECLTTKETPRD